jgi:hypothetical protein
MVGSFASWGDRRVNEKLSLEYPGILDHIGSYTGEGRTESNAFLAWFLEHYFRLDQDAAQDCICDGPDDKGVDGVYVNDDLERVDILQGKLLRSPDKTVGDTKLKEFFGTLAQFRNPKTIISIAETTSNLELRSLIESIELAAKVEDGYEVRGVFVTNAERDANAEQFLSSRPDILLFDARELRAGYIPTGPSEPITDPVEFDLFGYDTLEYQVGDTRVIVAPLSATDLLKLDGLQSGALFDWNVRQALGRTKVNRAIGQSIQNPSEHKNFLLYHNGLTILCDSLTRSDDTLAIAGYRVVNGCQSLTSLYEHRNQVTDELRILARVIQLSPGSDLTSKITHHSNNQNAINARDLQSNSTLQRRLQNEFKELFGGDVFYRIKRGESSEAPVIIDNSDAARILLAFDLQEPWSCHQSYKLFDDLHAELFARPQVDAYRVLALSAVDLGVEQALPSLEHHLMAGYRLTRYFLLYLLRQALNQDETGRQFCRSPREFLLAPGGRHRIVGCSEAVVKDLLTDLNAEIGERQDRGEPLDYKRELKSPSAVKTLKRSVIPHYLKAVNRGRAPGFGGEWEASAHAT